jgi:hypothetical protein
MPCFRLRRWGFAFGYFDKVEKLDLDEKALPALVGFILNQHTIAKASLMAYYGR